MRAVEWRQDLNHAMVAEMVLYVDNRATNLKFEVQDLRQRVTDQGDVKVKQQLVNEVIKWASAPAKGLSAEEQNAIVGGLQRYLVRV